MAKEFLVENQWVAGEQLLSRLSEGHFPIVVAFWAREPDSDYWHLYIASDRVETAGLREAYGEVNRAFPEGADSWLDVFTIKLIKAHDPATVAAKEIRDRSVPREAYAVMTHFGGPMLGRMAVEDVWIYPPISTPEATPE